MRRSGLRGRVWWTAAIVAASLSGGASAEGPASIRVAQSSLRLIDSVTVDVDARPLLGSANLRLVVTAADAPDAIPDPLAFIRNSVGIQPGRIRLTLPGGPAGADEVRLYHIPRSGLAFVVAARTPINVAPGVEGAALVRDLGREAAELGELRFNVKHREAMLVQAQFLRVRPDTEWDYRWFNGEIVSTNPRPVGIVSLGARGLKTDSSAPASEALCELGLGAEAQLQRVTALNPGDAVLVSGVPSYWSASGASALIILRDCKFAD